ncbi:MAG: hemolysin III family protein [Lachnospiraceae bacterium]|nr:hemolysin III family protein [Lachnospiraceae bacterium]
MVRTNGSSVIADNKYETANIVQFAGDTVDNIKTYAFHAKDPVSALTHFIGCIAAIVFTPVLLIHASDNGASMKDLIALSIFMLSMISLYGASASYHGFNVPGEAGLRLKRLDHMMIFVLIAGTYTPICVCAMGTGGVTLLCVIWSIAFAGMCFKLLWVTCPKWVSSVIYISMGWVVIFAMPTLIGSVSTVSLVWLYAGGVIYTIGGIIYALKLIRFNDRDSLWGSHEIFHLFVMAGSLCHFICIYGLF